MYENSNQPYASQTDSTMATKFCKYCGVKIPMDAVICTACGRQVEELKTANAQPPNIIITNTNTNKNVVGGRTGKEKSKWVALILCLFLGYLGIHRFYEGKVLSGILWMCTLGLGGMGILIDLFIILMKPNPYYV